MIILKPAPESWGGEGGRTGRGCRLLQILLSFHKRICFGKWINDRSYQRYHLDDVEVILFKLKNTFLKQKEVILKLKHVPIYA